jgi:hypothetical protein
MRGILRAPVTISECVDAVMGVETGNLVSWPGNVTLYTFSWIVSCNSCIWLGVSKSPVRGAFEVTENVFSGFEVPIGWIMEVASQESDGGDDIWSGAEAKPVETADNGLI